MDAPWNRREVLRAFAATAAAPALAARLPAARPKVVVIGAGVAGVATAWLLDGTRDVVVLERAADLGGNVQTVEAELDGDPVAVDLGAQFFHPGPYPVYTALLSSLGLFPAAVASPPPSTVFPASITIHGTGEPTPRFVAPIIPTRTWPLTETWNTSGLVAFLTTFGAARAREDQDEDWSLTLGEWLPTLGLTPDQQDGIILPWAASLFSGDIEQARGMSARAALLFAAAALPADLSEQVVYHTLRAGLVEPLRRMLAQCSTVELVTGATVVAVARGGGRRFVVTCADGRVEEADDVVFAASGPTTLALLAGLPGTEPAQSALRGIEFHHAQVTLHTDPVYAPADPAHWSFLNCQVDGTGFCESSMWLVDAVAGGSRDTTARLWKSWTTHRRVQPLDVLHQRDFQHLLPTPASIAAQRRVRRQQGDGIWFAGGYLFPYDAQETALVSALEVAERLTGARSARALTLPSTT